MAGEVATLIRQRQQENRSRRLAEAYNMLGLSESEAIEAFKR